MKTVEKGDWVAKALEKLGDSGIEAVKVEVLARALGVTKGSFYWHFADRAALLAAALETWEREHTGEVIARAEHEDRTPADRLRRITASAFAADLALERAVRAWAAHDERAATVLAAVDRRRLRYIGDAMRAHGLPSADAEARARILYTAFIGEQQIAAPIPSKRRVDGALRVLETLLAAERASRATARVAPTMRSPSPMKARR